MESGPWEAVWIQHKQSWGREDLPWDLHPEWFESTRLKESWGGGGVFFRDQFALENSVFTLAFQPSYPVTRSLGIICRELCTSRVLALGTERD